jgi:DNA modification methylase
VQLCVTSPPYYNLRDYGVGGQIGLEPTPELYIEHLVDTFQEVRRVLHDTGVLVLNLGDSYASQGGPEPAQSKWRVEGASDTQNAGQSRTASQGYKPKDLMGIPWRVALALQADGWWLRSDMMWVKGNSMPESVQDRPTNAHEYVFLLAKSARYFWDAEAIRVNFADARMGNPGVYNRGIGAGNYPGVAKFTGNMRPGKSTAPKPGSTGRNYRTSDLFNASLDLAIQRAEIYLLHAEKVTRPMLARMKEARDNGGLLLDEQSNPIALKVNTAGFSGAHFAVFPPELVEPFVRAGTSQKGVCPECYAPWERVVEKKRQLEPGRNTKGLGQTFNDNCLTTRKKRPGAEQASGLHCVTQVQTTDWQPTCSCPPAEPVPQTVLDPFGGAGTTALVADRLQRDAILCELNADYAEMARKRIKGDGGMFTKVRIE